MSQQILCAEFTPSPNVTGVLKTALLKVRQMYGVSRQRKALANLSNRQLMDIAITRQDAQREASRPFWDLPN